MAVGIRGIVTAGGNADPSVTLNGANQPQNTDVLLIICDNDYYQLSDIGTPTVGGSTTGVDPVTNGSADGGQFFAHCKAWTKPISAAGDLTVQMVNNGPSDEEQSIEVYVLTGADTTTPVDIAAGAFDSTGSTNHVAPSVNATVAGLLICHVNDGNGASSGTSTPPSGMTERYDAVVAGAMAYSGATVQLGGTGATGTKTFAKTGNATYAALSIVIKPAAGGTNATATPSAVTGAATVPTPTITAQTNGTATPSAVTGAATVPSPTITAQTNRTATPSAIAGTATVPTPTIAAASNATATPAVITGAAAVPAPAVSTGTNAVATPAVITSAATIPLPTVAAASNATATPGVIVGSATVPSPVVSAGGNSTATPTVIALVVVIPTPTVTAIAHATIAAPLIALSAVVWVPSVRVGAKAGARELVAVAVARPIVSTGAARPIVSTSARRLA